MQKAQIDFKPWSKEKNSHLDSQVDILMDILLLVVAWDLVSYVEMFVKLSQIFPLCETVIAKEIENVLKNILH